MIEDLVRGESTVLPDEANKAMQDFVNRRGRPAVFLILPDEIHLNHVIRLRTRLRNKKYKELDLVIHSIGGDIHAAYLIIALLHLHLEDDGELNACVPLEAKSAATLLCLGAHKIVLDEIATLGPLDTQIGNDKAVDGGGMTSALHPFKALEHLQNFSLATLATTTRTLCKEAELSVEESFQYALEFVGKTTYPLYNQLEAHKFGIYRRALSVGEEYGKRVLQRVHGWEEGEAKKTIQRMIHDYPSHHYIIDLHELEEMKLGAELFPNDQRDVVDGLFPLFDLPQSIVDFVEPTKPKANRTKRLEDANGQKPAVESGSG